MTDVELLNFFMQGLAPGIEDCWDLQPNPDDPDYYEELYAIAQALNREFVTRIDDLRRERNPATAVEKLQDYEVALGLTYTSAAQFGSTAQRQQQIVGRFRETGGLSVGSIQTVMQAYFGYNDPTEIVVIEPDRTALNAAHTYPFPGTPATGTTIRLTYNVRDEPWVSDMGAQVFISMYITGGSGADGIVELKGPDGFLKEWRVDDYRSLGQVMGMNLVFDLVLYAPEFAPQLSADGTYYQRRAILGDWTLTVKNMTEVTTAALFVEAIGRTASGSDGLGAAAFDWGVLAEGAKLGPNADLIGAQAAIKRMNHCHLIGNVIYDAADVASTPAIPDDPNAIPDNSIPG